MYHNRLKTKNRVIIVVSQAINVINGDALVMSISEVKIVFMSLWDLCSQLSDRTFVTL